MRIPYPEITNIAIPVAKSTPVTQGITYTYDTDYV